MFKLLFKYPNLKKKDPSFGILGILVITVIKPI